MERGLKSISDPNLIAKHICTANTRQYVQAHPTPIGSGGLAQQIGSLANTPVALALLQRQPPATQGMPCQRAMVQNLSRPLPLTPQQISSSIILDQFVSTYKAVKECTSSSISGQHVGHYKAVIDDDSLSSLHALMMSLPYMIGFSPTRWQSVVNIMLENPLESPRSIGFI